MRRIVPKRVSIANHLRRAIADHRRPLERPQVDPRGFDPPAVFASRPPPSTLTH